MIPDVVVDVGNTRVKWGLVDRHGGITRAVSLPEDPDAWEKELSGWPAGRRTWVMASVRPQRSGRLRGWLEARGERVLLLERASQLPLQVGLEYPDRVGIDRLLNAVGAKTHLPAGRGAVLIGAGTAVTVDWLDEGHVFRGGAIFPGLDLMADALHTHAALLPKVQVTEPVPELPAVATIPAMQVGIFLAVSGGIREAVRVYAEKAKVPPKVFLTGGQSPLLSRPMGLQRDCWPRPAPWGDWVLCPELTLVGIVLSVEAWDE
jgi:type III pantothenate kinase